MKNIRRNLFKCIFVLLILVVCIVKFNNMEANASAPYKTMTLNRYGELVETQDAYEPIMSTKTITGMPVKPDTPSENDKRNYDSTFNNAQDLFIDDNDTLYLVDTDNQRIVIMDKHFNFINSFGETDLKKPLGVFVRDNFIYVADYGTEDDQKSGKIVVFNYDRKNNNIIVEDKKVFEKPNSQLLEVDNFIFRPQKIAVDKNHTMYIVSKGSSNGILLVNSNNRFLNFFAPNQTSGTFWDTIKNFLYSNNENVLLSKKIPPAPTNVMLDDSGYIYTVTTTVVQNGLGDTVKKVNIGGINFYPENMTVASSFIDCWSSDYKTIYALTSNGFIYEYDIEGNLLFKFAGKIASDEQLGLFKAASSIATDSDGNLYVVDPNSNAIQVFRKTLFTEKVHSALVLYMSGKYVESKALWEDVLRYNSMFDLAHKGIGLAYYLDGEYEEAMEKFEIAYAKEEYSEAFWEVRNTFIMNNLTTVVIVVVSVLVALVIALKLNKKYQYLSPVTTRCKKVLANKHVKDGLIFFRFLRHPLDTIYNIRVDKSIKSYNGLIMLAIIFVVYILNITCTGFIFNSVILEKTILLKEAMKIILPIILFIIANYLISSLMNGEGTLRCIFMNTMGALSPIVVMLPIIIIISNVLTYNEAFIYWFGMGIMFAWTVILVLVTLKETHNFTAKQTFVNVFLTILMMFIIIIVVILVYIIVAQLCGFGVDIFKEVIF